jgi:MYXO-CTERM domain-containing protein
MGKPHCLRFVPWSLPYFCPWLDSSFFSFTNGGIISSVWNQSTSTITAIPAPSPYIAALGLLGLCLLPLVRRRLRGKVS